MSFYFSYDAANLYDVLERNLSQSQLEQVYTKQELHCTMLYNDGEYQKAYKALKFPNHITQIEALTIWNTGKDFVLVANLKQDGLMKKHIEIKDKFDLQQSQQFSPHITLQRFPNEEQLLKIEDLNFLIGTEFQLTGFRCIPMKKKNVNQVKPK